MQYFDKDGREIKAGMKLLMEDGSIEMVYDTVDSYGKADLGINASNETFLDTHPNWARECYSLKVIADTTGARAEYKFMPTCNYEIDYFTVTKDGTLLFDDRADSEEVEEVLEAIAAAGFECEPQDGGEQPSGEETKEAAEVADRAPQEENVGLTVEIPLDKVAVGNLKGGITDE